VQISAAGSSQSLPRLEAPRPSKLRNGSKI
jgi:hypothetical protein